MTAEVINFGCRLNGYESEAIKKLVANSDRNLVILNSCAVTHEAERQLKQQIRKIKREQPDKEIVVTGCAAQINPTHYAQMDEVSLVLGNQEKLVAKNYEILEKKTFVNDIMSVKETASHLVTSFDGHLRAFVEIQNGCNHRCTFCIIPFGRGNSRSIAFGEIVEQINLLIDGGFKEIVLTGVDISDYGKDLPVPMSLAQMIRRLLAIIPKERLSRLRISSIDIAEINDELFELLAFEQRIMPHLHISLQAGDNMILKRMKRRHTREQVVEFCKKLQKLRPNIVFGADMIAGFPTENDEMFLNSLNLISEIGIAYGHIFPFSARNGTPAARMPQVPKAIRKERAALLRQAAAGELAKMQLSMIGEVVSALTENRASNGMMFARAENFAEIFLDDPSAVEGFIYNVRITDIARGRIVSSQSFHE